MPPHSSEALAIEIKGVSKRYGYLQALKSVSLEVEKGESLAFMGSNGAGKTTLLKIIATHIRPSSGTLKIFGEDAIESNGRIRSRIGLVTHESYLYDELTIKENLRFYARLFSAPEENILRVIDLLGLRRWYNVPVKQLSFGLRKRADIARALLHDPDLVLLDEPFSGLDARACEMFARYFKDLQEGQVTIILSSHSQEWAKKLCNGGITMEKGTIIDRLF